MEDSLRVEITFGSFPKPFSASLRSLRFLSQHRININNNPPKPNPTSSGVNIDLEIHGNENVSSLLPTEKETTVTQQFATTSTGTLPMPSLPYDLIAEIFCMLPVKLLLQLRCLCKSFNSLISDPKFAKKHLRLSTARHHVIVSSTNNLRKLVLFDSPMPSDFSTFTQLTYPNSLNNRYLWQICSCDGILCFVMNDGFAVLWNPSIRTSKILPPLNNKQWEPLYHEYLYSFGYDHFINNYKIVVISCLECKSEVSVHDFGTESWRRIQDFPDDGLLIHETGAFVSGTVNWLLHGFYSHNIISLDLEKETYQKHSQPCRENDLLTLGVLKDCLCICASSSMFLDVWVMKEYGNKDSWTKLYNVSYMSNEVSYSRVRALYISQDEEMLIFHECGMKKLMLGLYDSKNDTLKIPKIQNINCWNYPVVYVESLISPRY